jgi:Cof subfamily protein (haloacid dehalogenase superfamily)
MYNKHMDFKNIIIYTDMDGTVLTDWDRGPVVPQKNLLAIKRFMEKGGTFSIASGRQHSDILPFFEGLLPNAPLVQGNGTSLYDCRQKKTLYMLPLSREYKEECVAFCKDRPWVWAAVGNASTVMQINFGDERDKITKALTNYRISVEEFLTGDYTKVVYVVEDPSRIDQIRSYTDRFATATSMQQTLSAPIFLECYSIHAGKDNGIRKAMELAKLEGKTLVCIGDFYNDESMLRIADIPACPSNAPDGIKTLCKMITCDNNEGALGDLIERLEQM